MSRGVQGRHLYVVRLVFWPPTSKFEYIAVFSPANTFQIYSTLSCCYDSVRISKNNLSGKQEFKGMMCGLHEICLFYYRTKARMFMRFLVSHLDPFVHNIFQSFKANISTPNHCSRKFPSSMIEMPVSKKRGGNLTSG